jgi:hypothetical protein
MAFDSVNGEIWFAKNGTWHNSATQAEIAQLEIQLIHNTDYIYFGRLF